MERRFFEPEEISTVDKLSTVAGSSEGKAASTGDVEGSEVWFHWRLQQQYAWSSQHNSAMGNFAPLLGRPAKDSFSDSDEDDEDAHKRRASNMQRNFKRFRSEKKLTCGFILGIVKKPRKFPLKLGQRCASLPDLLDDLNLGKDVVENAYAKIIEKYGLLSPGLAERLSVDCSLDPDSCERYNLRHILHHVMDKPDWRQRLSAAVKSLGKPELASWIFHGVEELLLCKDLTVDSSSFVSSSVLLPRSEEKHSDPDYPDPDYPDYYESTVEVEVRTVAFCSKYQPIGTYVEHFLSKSANETSFLIRPLTLRGIPAPPYDLHLNGVDIHKTFLFICAEDIVEAVEKGFCKGDSLITILNDLFGTGYPQKHVLSIVNSPTLAQRPEFLVKDGCSSFVLSNGFDLYQEWRKCGVGSLDSSSISLTQFEFRMWKWIFSPNTSDCHSKKELCNRTHLQAGCNRTHLQAGLLKKLADTGYVAEIKRNDETYIVRRETLFNLGLLIGTIPLLNDKSFKAWFPDGERVSNALFPESLIKRLILTSVALSFPSNSPGARLLGQAVLSNFQSLGFLFPTLPPATSSERRWFRVVSPWAPSLKTWPDSWSNNSHPSEKHELAYLFSFDLKKGQDLSFLYSLLSNDVYQFCAPSTVVESSHVYGCFDGIEVLVRQGTRSPSYCVIARVKGPLAELGEIWSMLEAFRESVTDIHRRFIPKVSFSSQLICPSSLNRAVVGSLDSIHFHELEPKSFIRQRSEPPFKQLLRPSSEQFLRPDSDGALQCRFCGAVPQTMLDVTMAHQRSTIAPVRSSDDVVKGGSLGKIKGETDDALSLPVRPSDDVVDGGAFGEVEPETDDLLSFPISESGLPGKSDGGTPGYSSSYESLTDVNLSSASFTAANSAFTPSTTPETVRESFRVVEFSSSPQLGGEMVCNPVVSTPSRGTLEISTSRRGSEVHSFGQRRGSLMNMQETRFVTKIEKSIGFCSGNGLGWGGTCFIFDVPRPDRVQIRTTMHMVVNFCKAMDSTYHSNGRVPLARTCDLLNQAGFFVTFDYDEASRTGSRHYKVVEVVSEAPISHEDELDVIDLILSPEDADVTMERDRALKHLVDADKAVEKFILIGHSGCKEKTFEVVLAKEHLQHQFAKKLMERHPSDHIFGYLGRSEWTSELVRAVAVEGQLYAEPGPQVQSEVQELEKKMSARDVFLFFDRNRVLVDAISRVGASGSPLFGRAGGTGPFLLVARFVRGFPESALTGKNFVVEQAVYCKNSA